MTAAFMRYRGAEAKGAALLGAVRGVNLATERLRGHSVERAPVDMGDLRGSATVQLATEAAPTSVLVFDEPYAAIQHEREDFQHTAGAAGEPAGEARYVAKNYENDERAQEYRDIIGKGIRDAFDRA
jgi:hypothetical protein